ncbi:glutamate synthase subunit beta [Kineococcus aurantiacus]|uniref:Glutamate synthase (NADPH/NADH) small chain n=1 Tax=Kineococcus aurantiacus TaxID=37633 RepID=A0A7Y9ASU0_9ACTN|nr:glutamate synthase subunit beta [Kineococcus aurantiacus]NYD20753.1 glutamate synthase (NADPH/NADH) small chain [Kineococcus aurantiacus]
MVDPRGFLTVRDRELPPRRPVPLRLMDWREVYEKQDQAQLQRQAGRCMDCGIPFCHNACPLGNLIPEWNDLVSRGDMREAIERLHATNNFPEFTGKLCPAPCESACVLGINQPPVTIKQVEVMIAENAAESGWITPQVPERLTGKTVAVVGSGPAGLAAAQQLTRSGHTVVVYERDDAIGGLMRYGIPEFKMERSVLDRRLAQMEAEGTRFRPGVEIGVDITGEQLRERFDAVVVATGATQWREVDLPGRDLAGIHQAMEYLPPTNRVAVGQERPADYIDAAGLDVVVIGGGDTGSDCYGTALRQGAKSVTQLDIYPMGPSERAEHEPWPTVPKVFSVSSSHEEGGERKFSASTQAFVGEDGRVTGLRVVEVQKVDGVWTPVEGTEQDLPAQLVLLAIGFSGPEHGGLVGQLGLEADARTRFTRTPGYATGTPGVFVAGDAGRGQSLIVWAIAEGRACAAAVDEHLMGDTALPSPIRADAVPLTA